MSAAVKGLHFFYIFVILQYFNITFALKLDITNEMLTSSWDMHWDGWDDEDDNNCHSCSVVEFELFMLRNRINQKLAQMAIYKYTILLYNSKYFKTRISFVRNNRLMTC